MPIEAGKVSMYVCGPTVYDYCHIGNGRPWVVFDVVQRWLRASGYAVTYVRNITDIDDKIIKRAVANNESCQSLTERFTAAMYVDSDALGVQRPDFEPKATEYVPQMLGLIERLQDKRLAYLSADGDINFRSRELCGYGRLSGKTLDDLRSGGRDGVNKPGVNESKEDSLDFVLWKRAKLEEPDEVKWPSKFGVGRPGWHIECSAMASSILGEQIDIHGGGEDLQFPHHENEIAQSEGAANGPSNQGARFVNYWMHNGFVQIDDEKMSKSLGNFFTIREVLKIYDAEVVRFFYARVHYRSPLNYSDQHLDDAKAALLRFYTALAGDLRTEPDTRATVELVASCEARFAAAMNDDFNTPIAVAVLFEMATELNRTRSALAEQTLKRLASILGILQRDAKQAVQTGLSLETQNAGGLTDSAIDDLIAARGEAKKLRDFAAADAIRKQLSDAGIVLEDSAAGTRWRRG